MIADPKVSRILAAALWVMVSALLMSSPAVARVHVSQPQFDKVSFNPFRSAVATVHRGETVYRIAERHGVTVEALIHLNNLHAPYTLHPGDRLMLPKPGTHVVVPGDTVSSIARAYGINVKKLIVRNRIRSPYRLVVGRQVYIPGKRKPVKRQPSRQVATATKPPVGQASKAVRPSAPRAIPRAPVKSSPVSPPVQAHGPIRFDWPLRGTLASGFGSKGQGLRNDGINIAAAEGTTVRAAADGVVVYADDGVKGYGNLVLIKHANEWVTAYGHNQRLLVTKGEQISRGQAIARVGHTGSVTSPQLHFEIRKDGRVIDPIRQLGPVRMAGAR